MRNAKHHFSSVMKNHRDSDRDCENGKRVEKNKNGEERGERGREVGEERKGRSFACS